jgi:hypothetical protein
VLGFDRGRYALFSWKPLKNLRYLTPVTPVTPDGSGHCEAVRGCRASVSITVPQFANKIYQALSEEFLKFMA